MSPFRRGRSRTLQYACVPQYIRYRHNAAVFYGILDGDTVRQVHGDLYTCPTENGVTHPASEVKLLAPCEPTKILAVGLNYRSHLGTRPEPKTPEMFYKALSSLQDPDGPIVVPRDATDLHAEGELVVVIGKQVKNATPDDARAAIFGVTCGNDVSERNWQNGAGKDLQWWRAKGSDTFAPLGPVIVTGIDYSKLLLQTRINGEVAQKQYTSDLIFDCPTIVAWVSNWVTLMPGDLIYTGTPGSTKKLNPGDLVEVEIESIGTLKNTVVG